MAFRNETDKRQILDNVRQDLQPISKAPRSIMDFPQAYHLTGAELDKFEAEQKAIDAQKVYKAVDDKGNVYTLSNPWSTKQEIPARRVKDCVNPTCQRLDIAPHTYAVRQRPALMIMTYAEAQEAAKSSKAADVTTEEKERW